VCTTGIDSVERGERFVTNLDHLTVPGTARILPPALRAGVQAASLLGCGVCLPANRVTNSELIATRGIDTTPDWIAARTGILERRFASPGQGVTDLACEAAVAALEDARVAPDEITAIVVATCTSEWRIPSVACLVQRELGATGAMAWDVSSSCSGFVYALDGMLNLLRARPGVGLVIGADCGSRLADPQDRLASIFFGDAAGAVVVSGEGPGELLASQLFSSGNLDALQVPTDGYMRMDGKAIWDFATTRLPATVRSLCGAAGVAVSDLRLIVPHQSNRNIIEASAAALELPLDRFAINVEHYGNTVAASVPVALQEARRARRAGPGDLVALVGYGGGLAWGGQLWRI
jgi:3-oxoacyl-[acyl-carrier-protein] synthase-3